MAMANAQGGGGVHPATGACVATVSSGAGASNFAYCITATGNVPSFKFAGHNDVIAEGTTVEGYAVCHSTGGAHTYEDYQTVSSGWNAPTTSGTATNFTVTRTSTDGLVKLTQLFTKVSAGGVKIKMSVTNLSATVTLSGVQVARQADIDIIKTGGDFGDDVGIASLDSATVYQPTAWGATLAAQTYGTPHVMGIDQLGGVTPNFCSLATAGGPLTGDDGVDGVYTIGNIKPGVTKNVVFAYTRY
jgi:hypothetical protein